MKNILIQHLLPTEDASQLYIDFRNQLNIRSEKTKVLSTKSINQHIYLIKQLTLDEIPKYEGWFISYGKLYHTNGKTKTNNCYAILFTTDPKLIADGVPAIDGNTKALTWHIPKTTTNFYVVNFLEEYCKRYNQKDNQKEYSYEEFCELASNSVIEEFQKESLNHSEETCEQVYNGDIKYWSKQIRDNQKGVDVAKQKGVDVEKLSLEYENSQEDPDGMESIHFEAGFKTCQALQSNASFSLEDMRKCWTISDGWNFGDKNFDEYIQSLIKEQPKEIIIELNDGNIIFK